MINPEESVVVNCAGPERGQRCHLLKIYMCIAVVEENFSTIIPVSQVKRVSNINKYCSFHKMWLYLFKYLGYLY